jgi:hypothetical protein
MPIIVGAPKEMHSCLYATPAGRFRVRGRRECRAARRDVSWSTVRIQRWVGAWCGIARRPKARRWCSRASGAVCMSREIGRAARLPAGVAGSLHEGRLRHALDACAGGDQRERDAGERGLPRAIADARHERGSQAGTARSGRCDRAHDGEDCGVAARAIVGSRKGDVIARLGRSWDLMKISD